MKKERKDSTRNHIKAMLALFCVMFIVLSVYLGYIVNVYGNRWFASPYNTRVANRKGTIAAGMLLDRNGVRLAYTNSEGKRKYVDVKSLRRSMSHVIGDTYGQTFGAESMFAKYLLGFDSRLTDEFEQLLYAFFAFGFCDTGELQRELDICGCGTGIKQVELLEYHPDIAA